MDQIRVDGTRFVDEHGRERIFSGMNVVDKKDFNKENNTHLVSVAAIHVEPLGIYGGKQTSLDALK